MDKQIIYQALYCSCIHESSYATLSLHKTKKGAEIAIEFHKSEVSKEYGDMYNVEEDEGTKEEYIQSFLRHEAWKIGELTLEE